MDTTQDAQRVLRDAETALRTLMEQGLKQQRYADVAEIARLADGLARLLHRQSPTVPPQGDSTIPAQKASKAKVQSPSSKLKPPEPDSSKRKKKKNEYPRFERDGERLIKVGWSKKNKEAYEHRAPRGAVIAFARHLASQVEPGQVFTMDDLFPVPDVVTGDEVPAYQAYLTLAWLRNADAIEKKGRDGYVLRMDSIADGGLDQLWDHLPERSH